MTAPEPGTVEERLRAHGLGLPPGHTLTTLRERPELDPLVDAHHSAMWEVFMTESEVANRMFPRAHLDWPDHQLILLDASGVVVATSSAMPLSWDGTDGDLPAGWDDQVLRSAADADAGREPTALGAMLIVVGRAVRGTGLSGTMLQAMQAAGRAAGYRAVIACVRPTEKHRYPLIPIERYATWTRDDGQPFDPWIRLHVRLGGRIVRAAPRSMEIRGSISDWESWTGLSFPDSGNYIVPTATSPVAIDHDRDDGVYFDQNVWVVHDLA
ncbi:MAG: hypothetical protein QOF49_1980 [Chloroflexota bacterium]|nr:hypothetical protein [Chloroflexota bacterium]